MYTYLGISLSSYVNIVNMFPPAVWSGVPLEKGEEEFASCGVGGVHGRRIFRHFQSAWISLENQTWLENSPTTSFIAAEIT